MYRTMSTIPERLTMKARYTDYRGVTTGAMFLTAITTYRTSMHAPQLSIAHQPMYFDQIMANAGGGGLYHKYKVWGIKYRFTYDNVNTNESGMFGVMHADSSTPETNIVAARERGTGQWRSYGSVNGRNARCVIKGFMSTSKALGIQKSEVSNNDAFAGTLVSDPTRMAYLIPYVFNQLSTGTSTGNLQADLTYYVTYFDRAEVAAS